MNDKMDSVSAQIRPSGDDKKLKVDMIKEGTVIDHIPPGYFRTLLDFLRIDKEFLGKTTVVMASSVESQTLPGGEKDIIKIEKEELNEEQINIIGIVAPKATVSIIRDYEVVQKPNPVIPREIIGVLPCPNKRSCISNDGSESIKPHLILEQKKPRIKYRCRFCEEAFLGEKLIQNRAS